MAEAEAGGTAATATTSGQSSSQSASQSQAAQGSGAQGAGSTTQTQTQTQTATKVERPAYVPEAHWDATAGKVKDTFGQHVNDLTSFKAEQDSRKLTLPQQADGYKAEFPKEWKPPAGFEDFKIKADDPLIPLYQQFAHKAGLSQEQFSEGFGLLASMRVGEAQMHKQASDAEVQKLGANGPSRVTAVNTWLNAQLGDDAKVFTQFPVIASMVTAYEKLMQRFSSQGVGGNNGTRREPAEGGMTAENYNKMTPRERLSYATSKQAPDAWRKQAEHVS